MKELDYNFTKAYIESVLDNKLDLVLSTSINNTVTSRTMCYINEGLDFIFLTSKRSNKVKQINENPKVSLCLNNIQIEGEGIIIGHPSLADNKDISVIFKKTHHEYYKRFAHFKAAVFIKVTGKKIKVWNMLDKNFTHLDLVKNKAYETR